jgi:uncharacterized protein
MNRPVTPVATCNVLVKPRARVESIRVDGAGVITAAVHAAPAEGEANRRLVRILAKALGVTQASVSIVRGAASRHKVVAVEGVAVQDIIDRLRAAVDGKESQ